VGGEPVVRVVVADDQRLVRTGFRVILGDADGIEVVGEAADGVEAVAMARRLRPDVALFDIRMPKMDGLEALRLLAGPGVADPVKVVVVTTFDLDEYVHTALRNGACGFLLKRSSPALLVEAVRAAVAGDTLISPEVTVRLLRAHPLTRAAADDAPSVRLTDRELAVARLVAAGRTNAEIGAELYLAPGTVKNHVAAITQKLGVRNRVGIAAWAWGTGLIEPTAPGDPPGY
jgi:DNA-binding NarL/FixJ family response regulator